MASMSISPYSPRGNPVIFSLLSSERAPRDVIEQTLGFMPLLDILRLERVSKVWAGIMRENWPNVIQGMVTGDGPVDIAAFKRFYALAHGPASWERLFRGHVKVECVPRIPRTFFDGAAQIDPFYNTDDNQWFLAREEEMRIVGFSINAHYRLLLVPRVVTIDVDETSPLTVQEGKLIEDPTARGRSRQVQVPITRDNIKKLVEMFACHQGYPVNIMDGCMQKNLPVDESHWAYLRLVPIARGASDEVQTAVAQRARLEPTPLLERVLLNLLKLGGKGWEGDRLDNRYPAHGSTPRGHRPILWKGDAFPEDCLQIGAYYMPTEGLRNCALAVSMPSDYVHPDQRRE